MSRVICDFYGVCGDNFISSVPSPIALSGGVVLCDLLLPFAALGLTFLRLTYIVMRKMWLGLTTYMPTRLTSRNGHILNDGKKTLRPPKSRHSP